MRDAPVARFRPHAFELTSGSDHANPFLVRVSASFVHESGATVADVPGFSDGAGRWIVRLAPPAEGSGLAVSLSNPLSEPAAPCVVAVKPTG